MAKKKKKAVKKKAKKRDSKKVQRKKTPPKKRIRFAPLPASFMLTAILGFIVSAFWVLDMSFNWGLTFIIFFSLMFIASIINMTKAPVAHECQLEK